MLALAWAIDRFGGEYPNALHPVVWIGTVVKLAERGAPSSGAGRQLVWGVLVAVLIPCTAAALGWGAVHLPYVGFFVGVYLLKSTFAIRALGDAGQRVGDALSRDDIDSAREGLRSLCSRDPSTLGPSELAAGAIESLAENTSDSVVAPLLFFAVAGVPGALFYRAVNTLDAMIGYHGKYEWLGKPAARLDDLLNLVPARLTALLLVLVASGADRRQGIRVGWRDHGLTESPNAGWPMATMAGLLAIRLEKVGHYVLGFRERLPAGQDVERARTVIARGAWGVAAAVILWSLVWPLR
jgi:adenosylcobinamide-phosphate synthase